MERIIVDDDLLKKLRDLTAPLELCDTQGHVLAHVQPAHDPALLGPLEPQVTLEELQRRANSNEKRYTTAEVLEHLRSL
jgi:hypothetical protein